MVAHNPISAIRQPSDSSESPTSHDLKGKGEGGGGINEEKRMIHDCVVVGAGTERNLKKKEKKKQVAYTERRCP